MELLEEMLFLNESFSLPRNYSIIQSIKKQMSQSINQLRDYTFNGTYKLEIVECEPLSFQRMSSCDCSRVNVKELCFKIQIYPNLNISLQIFTRKRFFFVVVASAQHSFFGWTCKTFGQCVAIRDSIERENLL